MLPVAQLKMLAYVTLLLIVLNTARFCRAEADGSPDGVFGETRHKRGPTQGLFAFPRVGRSDPADLIEWGDLLEQQQQQQQQRQFEGEDYEDSPLGSNPLLAKRTPQLVGQPRVGRAVPYLASSALSDINLMQKRAADVKTAEDYPLRAATLIGNEMAKRQGKLVAFPRVGRAGGPIRYSSISSGSALQKRASGNAGANSAMWFGPRLGKRANVASAELKGTEVYTPRLGRDPTDETRFVTTLNSRLADFQRLFRGSSLPPEENQ